jgi:hypothetical protein
MTEFQKLARYVIEICSVKLILIKMSLKFYVVSSLDHCISVFQSIYLVNCFMHDIQLLIIDL